MSTAEEGLEESQKRAIFSVYLTLWDGLTRFCGPTRLSLLLATQPGKPLWVFDPDFLLRDNFQKVLEYVRAGTWNRVEHFDKRSGVGFLTDVPVLTNTTVAVGAGRACFCQMWFAESILGVCSAGPINEWLAFAGQLLEELFQNDEISMFRIGALNHLPGYGLDAVAHYINSILNRRERTARIVIRTDRPSIGDMLEAVLGISKTREEGKRASGKLLFIDTSNVIAPAVVRDSVQFSARFPRDDALSVMRFKHVRKLLTAIEGTDAFLVANSKRIMGIGSGAIPERGMLATFQSGHGTISLGQELICNFSEGRFFANSIKPDFGHLRNLLHPAGSENSQAIDAVVRAIAESAQAKGYGCSIVLDLGTSITRLSGQQLEEKLNLRNEAALEIAKSMAMVDGALHIDLTCSLVAFGCLLDGTSVLDKENRERGARYNSAVRFTNLHHDKVVVIVSEDGPVSVFQGGNVINGVAHVQKPDYGELMRSVEFDEWQNPDHNRLRVRVRIIHDDGE